VLLQGGMPAIRRESSMGQRWRGFVGEFKTPHSDLSRPNHGRARLMSRKLGRDTGLSSCRVSSPRPYPLTSYCAARAERGDEGGLIRGRKTDPSSTAEFRVNASCSTAQSEAPARKRGIANRAMKIEKCKSTDRPATPVFPRTGSARLCAIRKTSAVPLEECRRTRRLR
jgi:hypothetical protein